MQGTREVKIRERPEGQKRNGAAKTVRDPKIKMRRFLYRNKRKFKCVVISSTSIESAFQNRWCRQRTKSTARRKNVRTPKIKLHRIVHRNIRKH